MANHAVPVQGEKAGRRVLVATDDDLNRALIEAALRRLRVEVLSVPDGVRAVEAVRLDDFDLVIMDLRVPAPDGLGALRRIRALPGDRGSVPVVAVAGDLEPEIRALLLAAGLDGFLWKPIRFRDLAATVQALRAGAAIPRQRRA